MRNLFLVFTCFLLLCTTQIPAQKIKSDQIASNFSGYTGVLLIQTVVAYKVINKILKKRFSKFYKNEFEILKRGEIDNASYGDFKKYPFLITFIHDHSSGPTDFYRFEMIDRVSGKKYITKNYPDNTIPKFAIINAYAKALRKLTEK